MISFCCLAWKVMCTISLLQPFGKDRNPLGLLHQRGRVLLPAVPFALSASHKLAFWFTFQYQSSQQSLERDCRVTFIPGNSALPPLLTRSIYLNLKLAKTVWYWIFYIILYPPFSEWHFSCSRKLKQSWTLLGKHNYFLAWITQWFNWYVIVCLHVCSLMGIPCVIIRKLEKRAFWIYCLWVKGQLLVSIQELGRSKVEGIISAWVYPSDCLLF